MGRWRRCVVALGLAVVGLGLVVPDGSGQARLRQGGRVEVRKAGSAGFLRLGNQGGYRLALYMPNDRVVIFYAYRFRGSNQDSPGAEYNLYAVHNRGNLEHGVVRASFGSLGKVSLRFQSDGQASRRDPGRDCEGGPVITEHGTFAGRLSFQGEHRYIRVYSPEGPASITHSPRLRCKKGLVQEPTPRSLRKYVVAPPLFTDNHSNALLYAHTRGHGRYVGITAVHPEGSPPGASVQLEIVEARHGMAIGRGAFMEAGKGTLRTSLPGAHPATATLAPPPPFYGRARYAEESHSWAGTLGVRLAGSRLRLTGPRFHVHLCVSSPLSDRNGCEFFKAETPPDERPARPWTVLR